MPASSICLTCKGACKPYPENPAFPFCSKRCKLADLSHWFNERYAITSEDQTAFGEEDGDADPRRTLH